MRKLWLGQGKRCPDSHHCVKVRIGTGTQVLFYANSVSVSATEKILVREGFTEEVLELPSGRAASAEG